MGVCCSRDDAAPEIDIEQQPEQEPAEYIDNIVQPDGYGKDYIKKNQIKKN